MGQSNRILPSHVQLAASSLALTLALSVPALAQTWTGATNGVWSDIGNWSTGVLPTSSSAVVVSGPVVNIPTIDGGSAAANILLLGYDHGSGGANLNLSNGATLTSTSAIVGDGTNSNPTTAQFHSGVADLSGASIWNTDSLTIGAYGDGVVNISGGSQMTTASLMMGSNRGLTGPEYSSGVINISGNGSRLTITSTTGIVGNNGEGRITVDNQGRLVTSSTTLGFGSLANGEVTVDGAGSRWDVTSGDTTIGQDGTGIVTISNGGVFSNPGRNIILGGNTGTGTLNVSDTGSQVTAGQIKVGGDGSGTDGIGSFSVTAGALVDATHLTLGGSSSGRGTAVITGAATKVTASTNTMVGMLGQATLTLSKGAILKTPTTFIAYGANSIGTVNIGAAAGSTATAPGTIDGTTITFGSGTGKLVLNHTGTNYTLAPKITGGGTLHHLAGVTNLTGSSGGFTGQTIIDGGTLKVLGTLGSGITVNNGGTLGGNGTVGVTSLNSGASIAPDGTLNVAGNLTFNAGSTYLADAGDNTSDQIIATGTVTINGGTVNLLTSGKSFGNEEAFKILGGNVRNGTFDSLSTQSAFLDALLDYSRTGEVWVNLKRNSSSFTEVASSDNQSAIANVLSSLPSNHPLVAAMLGLSAEEARDAMNQLSGDTHATLENVGPSVAGQVQNVLMNRIRQAFSTVGGQNTAVSSYMPQAGVADLGEKPDISYWLQGLGEYSHIEATSTVGGLRSGTAGVLGGADIGLGDWRVGAVGGYTRTGFTAQGRPATGNIQNLHAGIYAGADFDPVSVQFNALQSWHGISSRRDVSFGGLSESLTADYGAQTSLLFGEVGYAFDLGAIELEPFGSVSYAFGQTDAYAESGGASALNSSASTQQSLTTILGLRPEMAFAMDDKLLRIRGMLGWQHQAGEAPSGQYSLAGSSPFTVSGASVASNALVYETGLNLDVSEGLNIDVLYSGRLAPNEFSHGVKGIVAAKF